MLWSTGFSPGVRWMTQQVTSPINMEILPEVLTMILGGLTGVRVTKPGNFLNSGNGNALVCSLKTNDLRVDGVMYLLDRAFFFLPKSPTLILNDEVNYVRFERRGSTTKCMHYIDFVLVLKDKKEIFFLNIEEKEYALLYRYIRKNGPRIPGISYRDAVDDEKKVGDRVCGDESRKRKRKIKDADAPKKHDRQWEQLGRK